MKRLMHVMFAGLIIAMLTGCGAGNGEATAPKVVGVAAAGSPLVGTVTLKDSSTTPKELAIATDLQGSFSFDASGLTAPFLMQVTGTASGNNYTLYSLATTVGNCNINPLTNLAVTMANGGQDPTGIFAAPTPSQIAAISTALPAAAADIQVKLAPLFSRVGVSSVNVMTDKFTANGQGVDLLFDMVAITVGNGSVSMVNKADGGTILLPSSIAGGVLTASPDVNVMSSVFTITGHISSGGIVSARSKAPPFPLTPVMVLRIGSQGDYKLLVPNGTYHVCGSPVDSISAGSCVDVTVSNADVTGINFS